ncbi:hypothetical protein E2542_SST30904 [Spatholobus suberectus]|nr:hypothetical protein E2542_SST30904 [Spatholobus suberectus]
MYRPFMTCDDPKGVVECGAIRKYRTSSQKMKDKTKTRRPAKTSLANINKQDKEEKASKGPTERSFDPSSLQLMEVSRGAQRLNNMIDSWSRGLGYDESSEDIAKDLLKGALDLQESLLMLRKVQEASQHMASLKKKPNGKPERGRFDARVIDGTSHCDHFGELSYPMGFQRRWPLADGSSSSYCNEELKKVIKESLVRQNLLTTEGLDSASTFHSTNSSQSSGAWNDRLSDSSFSPTTSRKERGSNLVAKLMGLEEAPSRSFPAVMQKQLESPKILNQKRPIFDIDMPKVRKNVEKVNLEHKMTLKEILETTHFNGLLKKSPVREPKVRAHHSIDPHYKHFGDLPPIVLMKPRCTPYQECVKSYEHVVPPEELSLRNLKAKAVPSKIFQHREGSITNMGHVSKRVAKEERTKLLREVVELKEKEIKPIENEKAPGGKVKLHSHVSHKSQVNETVDKKAKVKTITISRKLPEKEVSKPKVVTKSQDQGEISSASTKLRKPQSGSRIDKNEIPSRKSTASNSNTISKPKSQKISNSKEQRKNQMKKQRPAVAEPEAAKPVDEQLGQEEAKSVDVSYKDDCPEIRIITTITDDLTMEHEEVDASANKTRENCQQSMSSSGDDILMLKSEHEKDAIPAEEAYTSTNISETNCKPDKDSSELKYLLLTSQSFIGHAEELLNLDVDYPNILPKSETKEIANLRLYLDCAKELTERKSLQGSQAVHPLLLTCTGNSRLQISLGRLVDEVYSAIEHLTSYSEKLASDNIYAMMERDMKSNNGLINGIWNWGWRHGFSADEAEQVVNEVENLVLGGLIEEVIVNL